MPNLGDYIGHILSEITIARMQADIEAVRVAELYADHPLLRTMPVPRFRMPDVELDIPVAVKGIEGSQNDAGAGTTPPTAEIRRVFDKVISSILNQEQIKLSQADQKKLKQALDSRTVSLTRPSETALDMTRISDELIKTAVKTIAVKISSDRRSEFSKKLRDSLRVELIKLRQPPPRLNVLVNTSDLREAGPNEVITRVHLKITEEAFEWTSIETDDGAEDRLVIE